MIAFEDLSIQNMLKNHCLAKSISDVAWNMLVTLTSYKAASAGSMVVLVDPRNTSKMCSRCGILVEKTLSDRVHNCTQCGLSLDRDWNAAINILRLGLQSVGVKRRQRTHAASGGASEALPHEVGARPSRSEPKLNTHALYPSRSELRGITFKNKNFEDYFCRMDSFRE